MRVKGGRTRPATGLIRGQGRGREGHCVLYCSFWLFVDYMYVTTVKHNTLVKDVTLEI